MRYRKDSPRDSAFFRDSSWLTVSPPSGFNRPQKHRLRMVTSGHVLSTCAVGAQHEGIDNLRPHRRSPSRRRTNRLDLRTRIGKIHGDPRMHRTQRLDMDAHLGMIGVGRHPIGKPPLSADTSPMRDQIAMLLVLFETQPRLPSPHSRPSRFPRKCAPVNSSPQ